MIKRLIFLGLLVALVTVVEAQTANITIITPIPNAVVGTTEVVVRGTGTALPENNVVVQALDAGGTILAEEPTIVDAELGSTGNWSVRLYPNAAAGTSGVIRAFSISPADGSIVAEAIVDITYLQTAQPGITITAPGQGAVVGTTEVVVRGTGTALPENNVVVQALYAGGWILAEQAVIVNAELGGTGNWSVALNPNVTAGTPGVIRAVSISPADGSIVAEAQVNVTYGQAGAPQPNITVNIPVRNETISPNQVIVRGTGTALPENNVVVRVWGSAGNILTEQATTVRAEVGGTGEWSVTLDYSATPNTLGTIQAFSISPADGSVIADARVDVNFGQGNVQPSIVINNPMAGATVNTAAPFIVSGTAANIFENNVIVRVRDSLNRTVRETVTTANLNGNWSVSIDMLIANGTRGSIVALSTSPVDNSVITQSTVNVTFASNCQVRTDWRIYNVQRGDTLFNIAQRTSSTVSELTLANCLPNPNSIFPGDQLRVPSLPDMIQPPAAGASITIVAPDANTIVPPASAFSVTGSSEGTQLNSIFVRLLDIQGSVLGEVRATQTSDVENGRYTWQADFDSLNVEPGTLGTVFAYALAQSDARIDASAAVNVSFGAPQANRPFITISDPIPYSSPELGQITVSGRGGGLFEGTVVVQALDEKGRVLAEQPTIVDALDAGTGGTGNWEVTLGVNEVRRGQIVAFSTNAADGSIMTMAVIDVVFGDPTQLPTYVMINAPLSNTVITDEQPYVAVVGRADGVAGDNLSVVLLDENGSILLSQPVQVDPTTHVWTLTTAANRDIVQERNLRIQVIATSPSNGAIIAADAISIVVHPVNDASGVENTVTGTVTYLPFIALVPGQTVMVQLHDNSRADAPTLILAEQVIEITDQQVPIPFSIVYNPDDIAPNGTYALIATIAQPDGSLQFTTTELVPVITGGNPTSGIEIIVSPVGENDASGAENTVTGTVTYLPFIALVPGQTVMVQLHDNSRADAPTLILAEQVIEITDQQVPIPFSIAYNPDDIAPNGTYALIATIAQPDGSLQFTTTELVPVITGGNPTSGIEIIVSPVGE